MPGPAPTPTAILKARGSWRAKQRSGEATPARKPPRCPAHLSEAAKKEWRRLSAQLHAAGLLTVIDGDQLALCCVALARWIDAEKEIATSGTVIKSPNGYPIQNPYLSIANQAMEQCHKYFAKFGMNPADRARAQVSRPQPDERAEGLSRFFNSEPRLKIAP